jgi:glycosyltransferase involved in cell wall biosynthesis
MKLLALVPKAPGINPSQRYRLEQWAPVLRAQHDITLDFHPFESPYLTEILYQPGKRASKAFAMLKDTWRRREVLCLASSYDAVIVHREIALLGPAIYEHLLVRAGVPLFFDFDDAIWLEVTNGPNGAFSRLKFAPSKTSAICRVASGVLVGNEYLARYARDRNPNVFVVPTTIDLSRYPLQPWPEASERLVIGWTGSLTTLKHLEVARRPLERLARRRKITVRVICSQPPERPFAGAENEFIPWKAQSEAETVGGVHIGMMPLPDEPFTRGKCALKALQFMATGRPVVVSPVGVNTDIVKDGENGMVAASEDEWVAKLERLCDDAALRRALGAAGRRTVEEGFSASVSAAKLATAVKTVLAGTSPRPGVCSISGPVSA